MRLAVTYCSWYFSRGRKQLIVAANLKD